MPADPVAIDCGGVSTGYESGGASFGSEYGAASDGSGFGGASAGTATVETLTVGDVAVPASTCWSYVLRPQLGLVGTEGIMHGGALPVPVYLGRIRVVSHDNISDRIGGVVAYVSPHLFSDLEVVNGLQFITLDKTSDGLCQYLTGRKAKAYPLKGR